MRKHRWGHLTSRFVAVLLDPCTTTQDNGNAIRSKYPFRVSLGCESIIVDRIAISVEIAKRRERRKRRVTEFSSGEI